MPVIQPWDLRAACRALHELAGREHILPSLTRAATDTDSPSRRHEFSIGKIEYVFVVSHEPAREGLPLSIDISAREAGRELEIDAATRGELVRAFFLGAHAPLIVERRAETTVYDMALQLSPTFYFACGQLHDETGDFARDDVCESLGDVLVALSGDIFASPAVSLSVWRNRILHELFGEAPAGLETLGPSAICPAPTPAVRVVADQPTAPIHAPMPVQRRAVASGARWRLAAIVALSLLGGAALGRLAIPARIAPPPAVTSQTESPALIARDTVARDTVAKDSGASEPFGREIPIMFADLPTSPWTAHSHVAPEILESQMQDARPATTDNHPRGSSWQATVAEDAFEAAPLIAPAVMKDVQPPSAFAPLPPPRPKAKSSSRPTPHAAAARKTTNPLVVLKQAANSVAQVVQRIRTGSYKVSALNSPYAVRQ